MKHHGTTFIISAAEISPAILLIFYNVNDSGTSYFLFRNPAPKLPSASLFPDRLSADGRSSLPDSLCVLLFFLAITSQLCTCCILISTYADLNLLTMIDTRAGFVKDFQNFSESLKLCGRLKRNRASRPVPYVSPFIPIYPQNQPASPIS